MHPIIWLIYMALEILSFALIIWIIFSWLIAFRILNMSQPIVYRVNDALNRLFEPMLRPIRRYMPNTGTLDLSPLVLWLFIAFLQYTIHYYFNITPE